VTFGEPEGPAVGEGMLVFEMDEAGKIQNQWVTGWIDS